MADRFRHDQSVGDIMTRDLSTLESSSTIAEAARLMRDNDTGAIIIADGGDMRGLLTDRDIARRFGEQGQFVERGIEMARAAEIDANQDGSRQPGRGRRGGRSAQDRRKLGPDCLADQVGSWASAAWKFTARPGTTVEMACL